MFWSVRIIHRSNIICSLSTEYTPTDRFWECIKDCLCLLARWHGCLQLHGPDGFEMTLTPYQEAQK